MPQISYRANLSAASFPLSLAQAGRSVIVPGPDNNYDRRVDPIGEGSDAGIPQALYLENVIPTSSGYQSVGLEEMDAIGFITSSLVEQIFSLDSSLNPVKITVVYDTSTSFKASGIEGLDTWANVIFSGTSEYPTRGISSAIVRGVCYVLIKGASNSELYTATHDGIALTLTNVTATVTPGGFMVDAGAICSAYNYLVVLKDDNIIYWSSTTTPTDFVASLVTGAGSQSPSGILGRIRSVFSVPTGFYIETISGLIYAQYTGNSRYPWKFVPVDSTSTIVSYTSGDVNSKEIFVLESTGTVMAVSERQTAKLAPELSTHLRKNSPVDTFNYLSNTFSLTAIVSNSPKIYQFFDRYICISCESTVANKYNTIILFDRVLNRYGKIKIPHTHLVDYQLFSSAINSEKIGVIDAVTGECYTVDMDVDSSASTHQGVLVLGKFQYVRSRFLALDEISIEGEFPNVEIAVLPSLDGKTFEASVTPTFVASSAAGLKEFTCRTEAKNQTVVIKGAFSIDCMELVFHPGGGR